MGAQIIGEKSSGQKRGKRLLKIVEYLLMFLLACALLYITFKGVKWSDFLNGLEGCNWWLIVLSMIIGASELIFRALRWKILLRSLDNDITSGRCLNGVNMAFLTNFILPRMGEFVRCGVVSKKKISFESALGTVVVERAFDLLCLIILVLAMFLFNWSTFGSFLSDKIFEPMAGGLSQGMVATIIAVAVLFVAGVVVSFAVCKRYKDRRFFGFLYNIISGLGSGLASIARMKQKGLFIVYTLLLWLSFWLTSYVTLEAFQITGTLGAVNGAGEPLLLGGADALFLMIVGALGWVVPVQGGMGAFHFIVSLALSTMYGISQSKGVVFATISHESQAIVMIAMGLVSLVLLWRERRSQRGGQEKQSGDQEQQAIE